MHELAGRDENVSHARLKRDRNGMRFARLRDNASVNSHFFSDRFSFHFRDLHLRNWAGALFLFPRAKSLRDPNERSDNDDEYERADDDSFLFHLVCRVAFIGR